MTSSIGIILIISVFAIKCVCCSTSYRVISINGIFKDLIFLNFIEI